MIEFNYQDVVERLKARFTEGTVQFRGDTNQPYIPNQVYTSRVENATNSQWNKEIKEAEINVPHRYVKVIVRVTIGSHIREGVGFREIEGSATGEPKRIATALDQAAAEAFLDCLDTWEMGWKDLAPFKKKDWGGNPALKHLLESPPPGSSTDSVQGNVIVERNCIFTNCGKQLTQEEWDVLAKVPKLNRDKMTYCYPHLRPHFKRELPDNIKKYFDEKYPETSS